MARSSISSDIAKLSKQKTIPAVVTDVLGNFCSVRLSIRGTRLHGLKYLGTTPIIGETVYVNYQSGTPVVYTVTGNVDSSIASAVAQIPSSSSGRSVPLEPPMIPGINHNDLSGLQGGLVASDVVDAEHYHLDATEYADLTDGGETNLHQHSEYVEWWYDTVDPTGNDDIDRGYAKADIWINQTANKSFICIDNVAGNAAWQELGTNGGGSIVFKVDGVLAVVDEATNSYVFTAPASILEWYVYLRNPGTSGQTIPDLILNETTSIFLDDYYDNRPVIPFYGASSWVVATPLITDFVAGDIITLNIDEVADGAADLVIVGGAIGGGGGDAFNLMVGAVSNVNNIQVSGLAVTNDGGGQVTVMALNNIVQISQTQSGAVAMGTANIPFDDTVPQNTEGWEYITLAITPTNANNYLDIDVNLAVSSTTRSWVIAALFQDMANDALAVAYTIVMDSNGGGMLRLCYRMIAGTTSVTTFKIRLGVSSGTLTVNGWQAGAPLFGGVLISSMKITEVKA